MVNRWQRRPHGVFTGSSGSSAMQIDLTTGHDYLAQSYMDTLIL